MADDALTQALLFQAAGCKAFGSAFYAELLRRIAAEPTPEVRALFAAWAGKSAQDLIADAVVLRFLGALHDAVLDGAAPALAAAFPPAGDAEAARVAALELIAARPERIAAFMAHEPQTNEVRRSACLLPGFLTVAAETGLPLRCLELGASAGLNQLWSRFHYRYGAREWGDPAASVRLDAEWRGAGAGVLDGRADVAETAACDRKPVDLADPAQRRRLAAYVWPDQPERLQRLNAAIALARDAGVTVEAADAADWTRARAAPRPGVASVVYHSIFWQYLPPERAAAVRAAIEAHGRSATAAAPFAWLAMEPGASLIEIELRLTLWPGGLERRLAKVQAHGAWIDWAGAEQARLGLSGGRY